MIKKILVSFAVLAGIATTAFAADDIAKTSFSIGISLPQIYNMNTADSDIDSEKYTAFGLNFAARTVITGARFGLFADGNIYFPYAHKIKIKGTEYNYSLGNGNSFWGIDGLLGAYTVLLNTGRFVVPLGAGLHINWNKNNASDPDVNQSALSFGLGAWANAELTLTEKLTIYGGVRLEYDFWQRLSTKHTVDAGGGTATTKSTESGSVSNLFLVPAFGVIFRF